MKYLVVLFLISAVQGFGSDAGGSVGKPSITQNPAGLTAFCAASGTWAGAPPETQARDVCLNNLGSCTSKAEYACAENSSGAGNPDGAYTWSCTGSKLDDGTGKAVGFIEFRTGKAPNTIYNVSCFANCTCTYPLPVRQNPNPISVPTIR